MISPLLWRKMLVTFLSVFVPLFLAATATTLTDVISALNSSSAIDWKVIILAYLTVGILPALAVGMRAILAVLPWSIAPTDQLHGKNAKDAVVVDRGGTVAEEPPAQLPGGADRSPP